MNIKKAQSQVISTILLILLVLIATGIVIGFVLPFIQTKLKESECLDFIGKVTIVNDPELTCFNSTSDDVYVKIRVGDVLDKLQGFRVILVDVEDKGYDITLKNPSVDVEMYGGASALPFGLPGKNEARTYVLKNFGTKKPKAIYVHPILNSGKPCDASDSVVGVGECRPD